MHGQRTLKKYLKYNEKEINMDAITIYRDKEVKIDISASSTFGMIQYGKVKIFLINFKKQNNNLCF